MENKTLLEQKMIRSFIALELKNKETIEVISEFGARLKKNQNRMKIVEPQNLHLTVKFLGDIKEDVAPKIYKILQEEVNNKLFEGKTLEYNLVGTGHFNRFSVLWMGLKGDIEFLQTIKDTVEKELHSQLKIARDKRSKFTPHLTIGRLRNNKINYKTFDAFKKIIAQNEETEFGKFSISQIKLKKSELTSKGPIYSDLIYEEQ